MEKINRVKLAKIENYLHDQEEIYHDSFDIEEMPVEEILAEYGIVRELTAEEKEYLRGYLHRRAWRKEIAEAVEWTKAWKDEVAGRIPDIPDRPAPCQRVLTLQHKMIMAEMEIEKAREGSDLDPEIALSEMECEVM